MGNNCTCFQNDSTHGEINLDPKRLKEICKISIFIIAQPVKSKQIEIC